MKPTQNSKSDPVFAGFRRTLYSAYLIFQKDLLQEFKTRYALNAIFLFALVTLFAVSFAIGTFSASPDILSALLWIILFFASMSGLSHIFVREEEAHTADTLKLVARPTEIFLGKLIFNIVLLFMVEFLVVPLYVAMMNFTVYHILIFVLALVLGTFGLAGGGTIVAAIIAKSNARGALFTVLAFPILLPVLVTGISVTKNAASENLFTNPSSELQSLFAFAVVIITAGLLLFDFIWNE